MHLSETLVIGPLPLFRRSVRMPRSEEIAAVPSVQVAAMLMQLKRRFGGTSHG